MRSSLEICFPIEGIFKNYHPPAFPPKYDHEITYDVSLGQKISRPIIGFLCRNGKLINEDDPAYSSDSNRLHFSISSMSANNDESIASSLVLCQYAASKFDIYETERFDSSGEFSKVTCGSLRGKLHLEQIPVFRNILIAQGLYHVIDNKLFKTDRETIEIKRIFEFSLTVNGTTLRKTTHPVDVVLETSHLHWLESPDTVHANHPFHLSLEIINSLGERIQTGRDSTLIVEVAITYDQKQFTVEPPFEDFIYQSDVSKHFLCLLLYVISWLSRQGYH